AWSALYAVSFSGLYMAMMLLLVAFIVRPVAFKFRSKRPEAAWRARWDAMLCFSGIVPPLVFGVAVGNVLQGVPFHFESDLRPIYTGSFFALFNPFALLAGLVSVAMLLLHGAAYLQLKAEGITAKRAQKYGAAMGVLALVLFAIGGVWISKMTGFQIITEMDPNGPSNPLRKEVVEVTGFWMENFKQYPLLWIAPIAGLAGVLLSTLSLLAGRGALSFIGSTVGVTSITATVGLAMFPMILPSSSHPSHSLTVWDASSSHTTLGIMLVSTIIFLPLVLMYTAWVYKVLWGKVSED